jgi:putative ABC transport system permease protein
LGFVGDVGPFADADPRPAVYVSDWVEGLSSRPNFVVRTTGNAALLVPALQKMVHDMNPASPLMSPRTLRDVLHAHLAAQELSMTLMAVFATLALTLAALGVYAVMAYVVAARTREFGIRAALGAARMRLLMLVLRQGMRAAIAGCLIGLFVAALGSRLLERLLSGVSAHDGLTFVAAPLVLILVTLAACLIPARAATRVPPVEALRAE